MYQKSVRNQSLLSEITFFVKLYTNGQLIIKGQFDTGWVEEGIWDELWRMHFRTWDAQTKES